MKNRPRSANIELLRIVAMFIIVIHHIVIHCVLVQLAKPASMGREAVEIFNHPVFYKKLLILDTCKTFGTIGNNIFLLISGFFRADRAGSEINMGKSLRSCFGNWDLPLSCWSAYHRLSTI